MHSVPDKYGNDLYRSVYGFAHGGGSGVHGGTSEESTSTTTAGGTQTYRNADNLLHDMMRRM